MSSKDVPLSGVTATGLPGKVTARVIANFAVQHYRAAQLFADNSSRIELENAGNEFGPFVEEIRAYVSAAILSSAAALEALINELYIAHHSKLRGAIPDFEKEFWGRKGIERKPILQKYQHALRLLEKPRFDPVDPVFEDAATLIGLRNSLVHFKPLWDAEREQIVKLHDRLSNKFALSEFATETADFVTIRCMTGACAPLGSQRRARIDLRVWNTYCY